MRWVSLRSTKCEYMEGYVDVNRYALALIAILSSTPDFASAHAHLIRSTPPDGSEVSGTVTTIILSFTEAIEPKLINIAVLADGKPISGLGSATLSSDGRTAKVAVPSLMPNNYTVNWNVVSVDGHRTEGRFQFLVRGP
jgi:copper resistance protein C